MRSKHLAKTLAAFAVAILGVAMFAAAAQAKTPAPGYEAFAGCPSPEEYPTEAICLHSTVYGGHVNMGNKEVPISSPITLSGGAEEGFENFKANPKGGLSPTKEKVPGGVVGLTGLTWLLELLGSEALTLYAVTELVGQPTMGLQRINLPVRVHLINSVLGSKCYIGSTSEPVSLHLTTGTTSPPAPNKPITGIEPKFNYEPKKQIVLLEHGKYVDNAFSAPGASGCVLTLFGFIPISINGLVNSASALPAAAGTNEAIQEINTEVVQTGLVYP